MFAASGMVTLANPLARPLQIVQFCIGGGVAWRTYPALLRPEGWLENEAQVGRMGCVGMGMGRRGVLLVEATVLPERGAGGRRDGYDLNDHVVFR